MLSQTSAMLRAEWTFAMLRDSGREDDFVRKSLWHKLLMAYRCCSMTNAPACAFDRHHKTHVHYFGDCQLAAFVHLAVPHTYGTLQPCGNSAPDVS